MKLILFVLTTLIAVSESTTTTTTTTTAASNDGTSAAAVTTTTTAGPAGPVCTQSIRSFGKVTHSWQPLEIDCPAEGGAPANVIVSWNMGGVGSDLVAVQFSVAVSSKSGGFVGLAANAASSKPTDTIPIEGAKQSNMLCDDDLNDSGKLCDASSYNAAAGSNQVQYFSIWNTGGCEGKIIIEAAIREFKENQGATCSGKLVQLGAPRSGNPDDLYCNVGSAGSCSSAYDEVLCGSIAAGYQCVAEKTVTTLKIFGFTSTCTTNDLSCQTQDFECATPVTDGDSDCTACNSNDCFGEDVLNPVSGSGINILATSIAVVSVANMIF